MMRNTFACAALALALTSTGALAQAAPEPGSPNAAEYAQYRAESIREGMVLMSEWQTAWNRHDARAVVRAYHPNALVRLPGDSAGVQGRAAVTGLLRSRLAELGAIELETLDVAAGDQLLYLFQRYAIVPAGGSSAAPLGGTCTTVLEREASSGWHIRSQVFQPSTAEPAAGPSTSQATPR